MNSKIQIVIDVLNKINAKEIKIYDTRDVTPFFEYLIIATASTNRQMNSLASYLKEASAKFRDEADQEYQRQLEKIQNDAKYQKEKKSKKSGSGSGGKLYKFKNHPEDKQ